jgi:protein ImuA
MPDNKADIISRLQKDILRWQGFAPPATDKATGLGLGPLEEAFPNGVFPTAAVHELLCPSPEHAAATGGFMAGILSLLMRKGGACLWISRRRRLFPPALQAFNVLPDRVVFIDVQREKEVLWATEEALKCEGLAAVIAEVQELSFAQSRRLQLAVEGSRVTGFVLRNEAAKPGTNTCVARWQVTPMPGKITDEAMPGLGFPHWEVQLLRVRNGNPGSWQLSWINGAFVPVQPLKEKNTHPILTRIAG